MYQPQGVILVVKVWELGVCSLLGRRLETCSVQSILGGRVHTRLCLGFKWAPASRRVGLVPRRLVNVQISWLGHQRYIKKEDCVRVSLVTSLCLYEDQVG